MAIKMLPEQEVLLQLLRYDPDTGKLFWRERGVEFFENVVGQYTARRAAAVWNARFAGAEAFTALSRSYAHGRIFNTKYLAHRVIWKMHTGQDPDDVIDHVNGQTADNRIENLRAASRSQNARSSRRAHGKSRFKGVYVARGGRFGARIKVNGAAIFLGEFPTEEDAARAYDLAAVKYHQEFALTNEKLGKFDPPSPIVRAA